MKELSVEQKAKRYDEVIELVNSKWHYRNQPCIIDVSEIFPELKESEDEKVRKMLIEFFSIGAKNNSHTNGIADKDIIAWLEKQGEQKPNPYSGTSFEYNGHTWGMCARDNGVEIAIDSELKAFVSLDKSFIYPIRNQPIIEPKSALEAIKEEKVDNANKVEPKFKVRDWINGYYTNYKVLSVNNEGYVVEDVDGNKINILFENEKFHHLWTIEDATDGDVLATEDWVFIFKKINFKREPTCYCHYDIELGFFIDTNSYIATGSEIYPATKEQRDTLLKAMANAGYTFDFKKNELKKVEQNPAWSVEDEKLFKLSLENLTELKDRFGEDYGNVGKCIDWLKSLKNRYT